MMKGVKEEHKIRAYEVSEKLWPNRRSYLPRGKPSRKTVEFPPGFVKCRLACFHLFRRGV